MEMFINELQTKMLMSNKDKHGNEHLSNIEFNSRVPKSQ